MAEKLKSRVRKIRWSLAGRAALAALAFLYSPSAFAVTLLALFCVPWFRTREFFLPLAAVLTLGFIVPVRLDTAFALGVIAYLFLGVKDLTLVDRTRAYEAFTLLVVFLYAFALFGMFDSWGEPGALLAPFLLGAVFLVLDRAGALHVERMQERPAPPWLARGARYLLAFMLAEGFVLLLFLPVHFLYQTALFAVMLAVFFEFVHARLRGDLGRKKLFMGTSFFLALFVITLTAAEWSVR